MNPNLSLHEWIERLSRQDPTPAGGALALVTLAGAAALAAKAARLSGRDPGALERAAGSFLLGAQGDSEGYRAALSGPGGVCASLREEAERLEAAVHFLEDLSPLFEGLGPSLAADAAAAGRLGRAAARVLLVNLAVNLSRWAHVEGTDAVASCLETLKARLETA